jgi:hypothetical protein
LTSSYRLQIRDHEVLREYVSCWDGPQFLDALGACKDRSVLEIGVGIGRIAQNVLEMGCYRFTDIDI